jgi:hypothetical protein
VKKRLAVLAVGLSLAAVAGAGASAAPPVSAAGSYQIPAATDNVTFLGASGGNLFFHEIAPLIYEGDITGAALDVDDFVVHADGSFQGHGTETCSTCTIGGRTGSYVATFTFQGIGDKYTGSLWYRSSAGGLTGLHGGGFFTGTESGTGGTYSYHYSFAP